MQSRVRRALCGRAKPRHHRRRAEKCPPSALWAVVRSGALRSSGIEAAGYVKKMLRTPPIAKDWSTTISDVVSVRFAVGYPLQPRQLRLAVAIEQPAARPTGGSISARRRRSATRMRPRRRGGRLVASSSAPAAASRSRGRADGRWRSRLRSSHRRAKPQQMCCCSSICKPLFGPPAVSDRATRGNGRGEDT